MLASPGAGPPPAASPPCLRLGGGYKMMKTVDLRAALYTSVTSCALARSTARRAKMGNTARSRNLTTQPARLCGPHDSWAQWRGQAIPTPARARGAATGGGAGGRRPTQSSSSCCVGLPVRRRARRPNSRGVRNEYGRGGARRGTAQGWVLHTHAPCPPTTCSAPPAARRPSGDTPGSAAPSEFVPDTPEDPTNVSPDGGGADALRKAALRNSGDKGSRRDGGGGSAVALGAHNSHSGQCCDGAGRA